MTLSGTTSIQMNEPPETKTSREDEKYLYIEFQYKGTCMTCSKYGHKGNTADINKVKTYQNFITVINLDI